MNKLKKMWKSFWYKQVEVHAVDINGTICASKPFYKQLLDKASIGESSSIASFYGTQVIESPFLPYKETRKRFRI